MAVLINHKFKVGTKDYTIRLRNVYDNGSTSNVGTVVGITQVDSATGAPDGAETVTVGNSLKYGRLARIRITYKPAGNLAASKSAQILCPIDEVQSSLSNLIGKNYNGGVITAAGIPRRRRLG